MHTLELKTTDVSLHGKCSCGHWNLKVINPQPTASTFIATLWANHKRYA